MLALLIAVGLAAAGLYLYEGRASAGELPIDSRDYQEGQELPSDIVDASQAPAAPASTSAQVQVATIDGYAIYQDGSQIVWTDGKMAIDYDGSPRAYGPAGSSPAALDKLGNAGRPGNWWALVTDTGKKDGEPIVQGPSDPYPGYYVSTTALVFRGVARGTTAAYLNSESVPFISIPPDLKSLGVQLGNIALVESVKSGRSYYAIVGDIGPRGKLGEGSKRLAEALDIYASGQRISGITYRIFLGSGNGAGMNDGDIQALGQELTSNA